MFYAKRYALRSGAVSLRACAKSVTSNSLLALALLLVPAISAASAATITVKKVLLPAGDTGSFTLQLKTGSGQLVANMLNVGNGAIMGPVTVAPGTYTVGEVAGGNNTNLANYTRTVSGAGCTQTPGGGATVAINAFSGNIVCTITNTRIAAATGQIRVKKILVPANDPGKFNLFIKNSGNATVATMGNAGNNQMAGPATVPPGVYTVSETAGFATVGTDYTSVISGAGCNANGTANVAANSNITCIITNTKKPSGTITVKKVTVPSNVPNAKFTLQIKNSNGQVLHQWSNGHPPFTLGPATLTSGSTYTITEVAGTGTSLSNYTTAITGAGCANGVVNLTAGANVVCTITNTLVQSCTGYPMQATVYLYAPGTPFNPQVVHICRGGVVKFVNNGTGSAHTVNYAGGPSSFSSFPLGAANGSTAQTPALNNPGQTNYLFSGFTLQGQIHVH